jgi:RNA polymerase sigma factor (sigma-70 family)
MTVPSLGTRLEQEVARARPVVERVVRRYQHRALRPDEAEDIVATVLLRLVRRLQTEEVESVTDFAATLTFNAVYDFMRSRFPEWTRLKNRLRYVLSRDGRFRMWSAQAGVLCALATTNPELPYVRVAATGLPPPGRCEEALHRILSAAGGPVLVDDVVSLLAEEWNVNETPRRAMRVVQERADEDLETREYLERLWREIQDLGERHRAALLLNLRDADGGNALALFVHLGIASIDEIAEAIGAPVTRLAELWNDLPLDDRAIATMLNMSRQQVINLRRTARERLARRMRAVS